VKIKYNRVEVKAKKIIKDSINKHLVAYISELKTSKEIYDKLVSMFKVSNANNIQFLKNKLKDIKKGKDEVMQEHSNFNPRKIVVNSRQRGSCILGNSFPKSQVNVIFRLLSVILLDNGRICKCSQNK